MMRCQRESYATTLHRQTLPTDTDAVHEVVVGWIQRLLALKVGQFCPTPSSHNAEDLKKEIGKGLLSAMLNDLGLTKNEFDKGE